MPTHIEGVFEVTSWSEEQTTDLEGTAKVTTARIGQRFAGGIEAETVADMVMTYREDGTADFVGYQRVHGRVGDRSGTFVLQITGQFDGKEAHSHLQVVTDSGSAELMGVRGTGVSIAPMGSTGTFSLDYEL